MQIKDLMQIRDLNSDYNLKFIIQTLAKVNWYTIFNTDVRQYYGTVFVLYPRTPGDSQAAKIEYFLN